MKSQVNKNIHFRHLSLFSFNRGAKAIEAACKICDANGQDAMPVRTA